MRHLKLTLAYDGTEYVGWQVQTNGISIQQRLEEAWTSVTQESIRITASGRTDKGVHALAQVCSLATESPMTCHGLRRALNAETPFDISVLEIEEARENFHAIYDAVEKTYFYQIQYGRIEDPLRRRFCWFVPVELDVEGMREAALHLTGEHDFASFQSAGAERLTTVRNIYRLDIEDDDRPPFRGLKITVTANGFLYKMVRNIVGSLVQVGRGTQPPDWVAWARDQADRQAAGQTAPPQGLFLQQVVYDE